MGKVSSCSQLHCPAPCIQLQSQGTWFKTHGTMERCFSTFTLPTKAEHRAHKQVGERRQIALGYVSTLRTEKKARKIFYQGATQPWVHTSAPPRQPHYLCQAPVPWSAAAGAAAYEGTARPAQGSWAHTINISTFMPLLHRKTSAFIILSYQLTQSKLAWNFWYGLPCSWLSKSCMPPEGLCSWDVQFSSGFAPS